MRYGGVHSQTEQSDLHPDSREPTPAPGARPADPSHVCGQNTRVSTAFDVIFAQTRYRPPMRFRLVPGRSLAGLMGLVESSRPADQEC